MAKINKLRTAFYVKRRRGKKTVKNELRGRAVGFIFKEEVAEGRLSEDKPH